MQSRVLRVKEVTRQTGICKATLYRWIHDGHFPPPIRLGPRAVGWREHVVEEWIRDREIA